MRRAITQGNFTDSENIHSIIGSDKANHIEVSHAGYVDGKGGNDVITAKNFTTIKGYFGDYIYGKGLVLLPINLSDIGNITHANNITNIYNKSGAFISVDKQTSVKTADGLFVTPTKVDTNTGRVTNLQITKLDDELDNLRKIDNSSFNITKQLSSTNYHSTIGSSSNHIFYPDKEHHNFYWEAPSNISHLYLFDERNANITIAQANGILDFSQLNSTLNDMPFIENDKGEIKINKNGLSVTLLPDYKDVTVTFDGEEYYKFQNGELERDYCSHSLKIDGRFRVNGTDLLNHHNCFTFDSDKVLFFKRNNDLLLLSDKGALSISDYYSSVHKNRDLSIELNDSIMEPEEFRERADNFSSFRYYKPDEQGLQIYHNQPVNRNDIGLINFKDKSILDFDMKVINDNLLLLYKNNTLVKVENWNTYQPAREMMFGFNDTVVSNSRCIVSTCNPENTIEELHKEKGLFLERELFNFVKQNNFNKVKDLLNRNVNANIRDKRDWTPLHYAVFKGRLDIVKVLSSRGANIEAKNKDGTTPLDLAIQGNYTDIVGFLKQTQLDKKLLTATENGDLSEVRKFVSQGANVIYVGIFGRKPIHIAAEKNYKDIIEFFLGKGVSVDDTSNYGWTPLHYAASKDCLEVAKFLIEKGADINAENMYGKKPIQRAAENNSKNIVELLLSKGVSVNDADKDGRTPLYWASWNGHSDVVEYLLGKGANISAKDKNGKTPLDIARDKEHNNVLEYLQQTQLGLNRQLLTAVQGSDLNKVKDLIVRGASLDTQDSSNGWTPIIYAAQESKWDVVKFFIAQGAKFNNEITYQGTPLHFAIQEGNLNMVQFLLDKGANIEAQDAYNRKPLHLAVDASRLNVVNLLLDRGANLKATDMYGKTPLDLANQRSNTNIVGLLKQAQLNLDKELLIAAEKGDLEKVRDSIRRGANVNAQSRQGWTSVFWAIQKNNFNIVKLLLDNSVDIKAKDNEGWISLHWAVQLGLLDVVESLVERGADVNALTTDGRTPYDLAINENYREIKEYLRSKSAVPSSMLIPHVILVDDSVRQRKRRHHHGDHDRHHSSRRLLVTDSSNQLEIARSNASQKSSWINDLFSWVRSSIGELFSSKVTSAEETLKAKSSISQVDARADVNSAIMLLDVLVRKITGQKYISTVEQQVPLLEARSYALNITERFEKVVEQAAKGSKISMHRLNIDFMEMEKEITGKIIGGKFNEIAGVLSSYVEKACPGREAGKLSSKKFDKFMTEFNNKLDIALNQSIQQILHSGSSTLNNVKEQQISLEPKSYLSNTCVQNHLTQARGLGLR